MVWEGPSAIALIRQTMGATNPLDAAPGTIRHDLALLTSRNLTHASDSVDNAEHEISLWFSENEIFPWDRDNEKWFTGKN
jgi:nucleoside-diphosphate kinase